MTRLEKIKMAIEKGISCDINSGKVYGVKGGEITTKIDGYIHIYMKQNNKAYKLKSHQFIFYKAYGRIVEYIDHINGDRSDNRIENLREVSKQQNQHNQTRAKGYRWNEKRNKYEARITLNKKTIHLGRFDKEEDARQAYLEAKKIYHKI